MAITESGNGVARGLSSIYSISESVRRGSLHLLVKVYLTCLIVPFSFKFGPLNMTGARVILLILFIPMLHRLFTGKMGKVNAVDYFLVLHFFWIIVTLAINNPTMAVQNAGSTGLEFLGGYLLGRTYIRSKEQMIGLFRYLVFLVLCTLPLALYETMTGKSLLRDFLQAVPGIGSNPKTFSEQRMGLERVQMGYITPIHYGIFCTLVFSFCFVGLKGIFGTGKRILATIGIGICTFVSLSSGALLPMLLQIFLIAWGWLFRKAENRWIYLMIFLAIIYIVIDLGSNRTPTRVLMSYATFSTTTAYWRLGINEWGMKTVWANPIFGIGFADWVRPQWMYSSSVDNYWLLVAMRHGIPAFLFVAAGYGFAMWQVLRRKLGPDPVLNNLRLAWVFCFIAMGFTLITVHIWAEVYSYTFFLLGAGMWLLDVSQSKDGAQAESATSLRSEIVYSRGAFGRPNMERPEQKFARDAESGDARTDAEGTLPGRKSLDTEHQRRENAPRYTRFDRTGREGD